MKLSKFCSDNPVFPPNWFRLRVPVSNSKNSMSMSVSVPLPSVWRSVIDVDVGESVSSACSWPGCQNRRLCHWCSQNEGTLFPVDRLFHPIKCWTIHKWPLWRAAPQHDRDWANGRSGPQPYNLIKAAAIPWSSAGLVYCVF